MLGNGLRETPFQLDEPHRLRVGGNAGAVVALRWQVSEGQDLERKT